MNESVKQYQTNPVDEMELLKSLARFKDYSINNMLLAKSQYQGALGVASYKDFQKIGYQVQKGEKAIYIFAPQFQKTFLDENNVRKPIKYATKVEKQVIKNGQLKISSQVVGYRRVPVFDITQTNCPAEDYPELYPNRPESFDFKGTTKDLKAFEQALYQYAKEKNVKVSMGKTDSAAKGFYVPSTNEIVLKDTLTPEAKIKVLLHELAHAEMHNHQQMASKSDDLKILNVIEYQAEMTAYVVSHYIGIDSADYSQKYLASWTKKEVENDIYIQSLEEVREVSLSLVDHLVGKYNEIKEDLNLTEDESIAKKLNFLTDSEQTNHYPKLKNNLFKCLSIEHLDSGKYFTDYSIELEDQESNNFQYKIRTKKNKKEIRNEWTKEKIGKQWLNEDLKTEILKRKPSISIENAVPEKKNQAQDI